MKEAPIFFALVGVVFAVVVGINFTRYVLQRDYYVFAYALCAASETGDCFKTDVESPDAPADAYKKVFLRAADAPACLEERSCESFACSDIDGCEEELCTDATVGEEEHCVRLIPFVLEVDTATSTATSGPEMI